MFKITGEELAQVCNGSWLQENIRETQRQTQDASTGSKTSDASMASKVSKSTEAAQAFNAQDLVFTGVSIDSRTIQPGELFVVLQGKNFDGHDFLEDAFLKGATGAIVSSQDFIGSGMPQLLVENTLKALQDVASWWRQQFNLPVLAITGSSGKTTTKDILASLIGTVAKVHCNPGNLNNEIGVPLTLLDLTSQHQVCVLEMGMRGLGEIGDLCAVAQPNYGIITNVGSTHFELLGSIENIARAKGELAQSLPETGFVLLNSENPWSDFISARTKACPVLYGLGPEATVRAEALNLGPDYSEFTLRIETKLEDATGESSWDVAEEFAESTTGGKPGEVAESTTGGKPGEDTGTPACDKLLHHVGEVALRLRVPLPGEHNVYNSLAAIGAYLLLGFPRERLQEGLNKIQLSGMRLQRIPGIRDSVIINDTYNANPSSIIASLKVLQQSEGKRRIAVLGDMFELGEIEEKEHRRVGEAVWNSQVDLLITLGDLAALIGEQAVAFGMEEAHVFHGTSYDEAEAFLKECVREGDVVLVKGSRGMRMERFVAALQGPGEDNV